MRRAAIR